MYHCISFSADEIYCLKETDIAEKRILLIGFCPICQKPVAELVEELFTGGINRVTVSGINAQNLVQTLRKQIISTKRDNEHLILKSTPYGWRYGINKENKNGKIRQYACDFYGNKELVKEVIK